MCRLKKAIPSHWISEITSNQPEDDTVNPNLAIDIVNVCHASAKSIYDVLIQNKFVRPTALDRWLETFEIIEDDWKVIFKQPYLSARETKLQSIQYKILHRIIPCRK